jgi:hypothetical protein
MSPRNYPRPLAPTPSVPERVSSAYEVKVAQRRRASADSAHGLECASDIGAQRNTNGVVRPFRMSRNAAASVDTPQHGAVS